MAETKMNVKEILIALLVGFVLSTTFASCVDRRCVLRSNTCQNGGVCEDGICDCPPGYTGEDCEYYEPCTILVCENGGTCGEWSGECDCVDGYTGTHCEIEARTEYLGNFLGYGTRSCQSPFATVPVSDIPFTIEVHPDDVTKVLVHFDGQILEGRIEGNSMIMFNQPMTNFYTYSGSANTHAAQDSLYISFRKNYAQYDCRHNLKAALH